jgi:hypothetical protein
VPCCETSDEGIITAESSNEDESGSNAAESYQECHRRKANNKPRLGEGSDDDTVKHRKTEKCERDQIGTANLKPIFFQSGPTN